MAVTEYLWNTEGQDYRVKETDILWKRTSQLLKEDAREKYMKTKGKKQ